MKKLFRILTAALLSAAMAITLSVTAFAEDYVFDTSAATKTAGSWAQSLIYYTAQGDPSTATDTTFDPTWMTSDSAVVVTFESAGSYNGYPCELIWQTWDVDGVEPAAGINSTWNKVAPSSYDDTTATFTYDDIVASYGTSDFKDVYAICLGDTGNELLVTGLTITNCNIVYAEVEETEAEPEAEEAEEVDEEAAEEDAAEAEAETEAEEATAAVASSSTSGTNVVLIVVLVVVILIVLAGIAALVIFILKKSKNKYY